MPRFSISQVQRAHAGEYLCTLSINGEVKKSRPIMIDVEGELYNNKSVGVFSVSISFLSLFYQFDPVQGLPTFTQQPEDLNVTKNAPFTLTCRAVGPPEPVEIHWLRNGLSDSERFASPSSYSVPGETPEHDAQ